MLIHENIYNNYEKLNNFDWEEDYYYFDFKFEPQTPEYKKNALKS